MLEAPGLTVVMTGGIVQRDTISLIGSEGSAILRKYNIKTGFFGAHGLSFPEGLADMSAGEAEAKREIVSMSRQAIAIINASKWGRVGSASFANPLDIHIIITDERAPAGPVEQARSLGTRILQV